MRYELIETELDGELNGEPMCFRCLFDFEVTPGYPAKLGGHPDDRYEDLADDYEIMRIQLEVMDGVWCDVLNEYFFRYNKVLTEIAERKAFERLEKRVEAFEDLIKYKLREVIMAIRKNVWN